MVTFYITRDVKLPEREFGNAGFDFFVPNDCEEFRKDFEDKNKNTNWCWKADGTGILVAPNHDVIIPSGVYSLFPSNLCLVFKDKSGQATKKKFKHGACVVDHNYEGEIFMHIFNNGTDMREINFGEKIAQYVPFYIDDDPHACVIGDKGGLADFYKNHIKNRGEGWQGSTNEIVENRPNNIYYGVTGVGRDIKG